MAKFEDVVSEHKDALGDEFSSVYEGVSSKLSELGFEILLNNKAQAEFVPSGRLSDVVSQRDNFKTQVELLNSQLNAMKTKAEGNDELQTQLQKLIDDNSTLLAQLEQTKIDTEIMLEAKDAIDAKDVLLHIDRSKIKVDGESGAVSGAKEEVERIRQAKPYLFSQKADTKGGSDSSGSFEERQARDMNAAIRRMALVS